MADDSVWLQQRLVAVEAYILAVELAQLTIAGGAQSYSLDTGQTKQTVTKSTVSELDASLKRAEQRRDELRRLLGLACSTGSQVRVIPGF